MDHSDEGIVVTCIDFRLQESINKWISEHFQPKTYDRVALGGGVKNLDIILSQIDIAVMLHRIKKVVLINHEACGAYGDEGSPEKHKIDLKITRDKVKEFHSDLEIELYYLHLDGTFESVN